VEVTANTTYTVPSGKNLYLNSWWTPYEMDILLIDGYEWSKYYYQNFETPFGIGSGESIGGNETLWYNGFLVDAEVEWITLSNLVSSPYTVPTGKALWILFAPQRYPIVDGVQTEWIPLVFDEGQVISIHMHDSNFIRGYLRDK
jgi:hypothetical protein